MADTSSGRNCKILVDGTQVYYTTVFGLDERSEQLGAFVHGNDGYKHYVGPGGIDLTFTGEYLLDLTDGGQNLLRNAFTANSGIEDIKFYWNSTNYTQPSSGTTCYISECTRSAPADGIVTGTFAGMFDGAIEEA